MIFDIVPNSSIKWISLGTLRMPAYQKIIIENRFPETEILNGGTAIRARSQIKIL
jgi:spore photoproduct lyase